MTATNPLRLLALTGPVVALACLAPAGAAQDIRPSSPAAQTIRAPASARPSGFQGLSGFGSDVAVDGDRVAISDNVDVLVYNTALGAYESGLFLQDPAIAGPAAQIHDIAIEGDWLLVAYQSSVDFQEHFVVFHQNGTEWVVDDEVNFLTNVVDVEIHDNRFYFLSWDSSTCFIFSGVAGTGLIDLAAGFGQELGYSLAVGDGPTIAVATLDLNFPAGIKVRALEPDLSVRAILDVDDGDGFVGALAAADGHYWVGHPFDGNKVRHYVDDGSGSIGFVGEVTSEQDGDMFGNDLALDGDTLLISERHSELLALTPNGGFGVGAVRVVRHDGLGSWKESGEVVHSLDYDYTTGDEFGFSVAIDGLFMVVGEPEADLVTLYTLPATSMFEQGLTPGLAGAAGEPSGRALGLTVPGLPFGLEIEGSVPSGTAFLVLGLFDLSVPFKGGVLLPTPDIVTPLPLDGSGDLLLPFIWSTSGTSSFTLYGQYWIPDAGAPVGFSATPGFSFRQDG